MTPFRRTLLASALSLLLLPCSALAALPVEIEVVLEPGAPRQSMQLWAKALGECDLARVNLRGARRGDEVNIEMQEYRGSKRYKVTGIIDSRDQLIVPGAKFRVRDRKAMADFFRDLPGKQEHNRVERGRFGLTEVQFRQVYESFSRPAPAKLQQAKRAADAYYLLTADLGIPVQLDAAGRMKLGDASPTQVDLSQFTRGTALAMLLRHAGLAMTPEQPLGGKLQLRIVADEVVKPHTRIADRRSRSARPQPETWPVGWQPEPVPRVVAPRFYSVTVIEIEGFTLAKALAALQTYGQIPLVFDERVLKENKIEPDSLQVKVKKRKMLIRTGIDTILSQARLAGELRVDEAGTPFYWMTQFGQNSPRATK